METIDCHQAAITSLAFSKEGNYLATGGADALILIWSLPELINVASFLSIESEVKSLSFSYDEKWLSAVGNEELFYVYSVEKGLTGICDHIDTVKCDEKTP
jgi:peptide/nickel transport system permease protein